MNCNDLLVAHKSFSIVNVYDSHVSAVTNADAIVTDAIKEAIQLSNEYLRVVKANICGVDLFIGWHDTVTEICDYLAELHPFKFLCLKDQS